MTVQSIDPKELKHNPNITMTESAVAHFKKQLARSEGNAVRLYIEESGCSGYMYRVALVSQAEPGDESIAVCDDFPLHVQGDAITILKGTEIDFRKDGLNELVMFNNPNVTGECGCGESFVVEAEGEA
ncbi:HesB/IscA family protein [Reinekea marinisedimentorum]|uniref:Iron-sulfur cluster assembly protein n=1 Tax=Reinekea marinisedimentorum TaxID=230495 RepID=A0A4R3I790_9GAMM|nr:iron-sulfur cluster assembly accessory protein [Reinekea marinisedimentorum]TCS42015.1 iron-sulfur cluster assembly protein [Reinekea marinisedimentorum]